jgi:hypothetical protein
VLRALDIVTIFRDNEYQPNLEMPRDAIPEDLEDTMARLAERAKSPSLESLTEAPPFFFGK